MTVPKISIIIVNYNGKTLLEKCLESLYKVNYDNVEVILVDNNSTDGTMEFVTKNYPSIITIKLNSNKGFAEPNNIGSKIAKGEYLLFLNNDTVVTPDFVSELVKVMESDKKTAICQSLLLKPDGTIDSSGDFIDKLGVVYNSKTKSDEIRTISSARGASMLIRNSVFKKLDGFDEKFFVSFEDVDLGWRTWILGYRVKLVPKSIVYHHGGTTIEKIKSEIAFHGFKNQLSMKITNFEPILAVKNMLKFFIIYGTRELKIWFDYKIYGRTKLSSTKYENNIAPKPSFKIIFNSIWWVLKNQKYLIQKQRKINSERKVSTHELEKMNILCEKYY
ncbi:glycoprotein 3-alpha-L-fucosyltransferase [Marine Group I thaumarchaeote SCGC AAA799-P11]|uniref:Glycoprotein 3-alpha-L-fucosyltransferase n=1 Tax=Marine Group I thaumarchaeote SCGC AAA799-P11 TaxID=1502295 RepID=A0A087S322_9ARCH|nr:glycoprotein 3-alpha-L-fucosyltransferase [Marine Group I thaumarchaeote SCGC AAA799-P11]